MFTTEQFQARDFHIVSDALTGFKPVDAICQFMYKGYKVSVSTAGLSQGACQTEVQVMDSNDNYVFPKGFHTVEEAIKYIDDDNVVVIAETTSQYPFIFARATEESQTLYEQGKGNLVIKDWVMVIAHPDFTVYDSRWMADPEQGNFCLVPDVDISVDKDQVFATFEEAKQAVGQWWVNQIQQSKC